MHEWMNNLRSQNPLALSSRPLPILFFYFSALQTFPSTHSFSINCHLLQPTTIYTHKYLLWWSNVVLCETKSVDFLICISFNQCCQEWKTVKYNECLCWMDAWYCLKARHWTRWPWAGSQSQWPIVLQSQTQVEHSCWLPNNESGSSSGPAQSQHLLNLQVLVKCHLLREALQDHPSEVAQGSKAELGRQSAELGSSQILDNPVKSSISMFLAIWDN